jgi:hypothetical protein
MGTAVLMVLTANSLEGGRDRHRTNIFCHLRLTSLYRNYVEVLLVAEEIMQVREKL